MNFPRLRKIKRGLDALRRWFSEAVEEKKGVINLALGDTDSGPSSGSDEDIGTAAAAAAASWLGDEEDDPFRTSVDKDLFSRIVLASQKDQKFRLDNQEIVSPLQLRDMLPVWYIVIHLWICTIAIF